MAHHRSFNCRQLGKKLSRGTIHKNAWVKFQNINKWIPQIFAYSSVVNDFELVFDF